MTFGKKTLKVEWSRYISQLKKLASLCHDPLRVFIRSTGKRYNTSLPLPGCSFLAVEEAVWDDEKTRVCSQTSLGLNSSSTTYLLARKSDPNY